MIEYKSRVESFEELAGAQDHQQMANLEIMNQLTIKPQGDLIKTIDSFSFDKNSVETACQNLDFTQILLLIRAVNILGVPLLDEDLTDIAVTKKIDINNTIDFLDPKYANRILQKKLFAIKEVTPLEIWEDIPRMFFSPDGKYLIYQSFETTGWLPTIIFWDCEKKKKAYSITKSIVNTICPSPDKKYFVLLYRKSSHGNARLLGRKYESDTLKISHIDLFPWDLISFTQKDIPVYNAGDGIFPLQKTIPYKFLTDEQIKNVWESRDFSLTEDQEKAKHTIIYKLHFEIYHFHNEHKQLLCSLSSKKKFIIINSTENFSCVKIIPALIDGRDFYIKKASFSPLGNYLAACGTVNFLTTKGETWKPTLRIWNTSDWSCVGTIIDEKNALLKERNNTFDALCFAPDDSMIAVGNSFKKEVCFCGPLNLPNITLNQLNYCMYHIQENGNIDEQLKDIYNKLPDIVKSNLKKPQFFKFSDTLFSEQLPEHLKKFASVPQPNELLKKNLKNISIEDDFPIARRVLNRAHSKKQISPQQIEMQADKHKANLWGSKSSQLLLERARQQRSK